LLLVVGVVATPVQASNWLEATKSTTGSTWFVDLDSVQRVGDGYNSWAVKAWVKIDHSADKTEAARETKSLYFFKCEEERAKNISRVQYRADGTVIDSYSPSYATYNPVVPDTVLSAAMQMACTAYDLSTKSLSKPTS